MLKLSTIVVAVDPTCESQPALERAAWLASQSGARLDLLICYYNEYLSGDRLFDAPSLEKARAELIEAHSSRLEQLAEPLREKNIAVTTSALWDHPLHEGIVRHAVEVKADLVFKDTHHHSALSRALLSNTDWNLIRTCPAPLWLVKPHELRQNPIFVASIDPMNEHDKPAALDDEILSAGKSLAEVVHGKLHAFHCYDPTIAVSAATANAYVPVSLPLDEIEKQMHDEHQKRFEEITRFHGLAPEAVHLEAGQTHVALPALATELDADVVIMGAVARNRWKRLFIGATAERTLEHVPCDMLIIKPDWFHTPVEMDTHEAA